MASGEANVDRVSPSETWDLPTQVEKNAAVQLLSLHGKPAHRASGGGHAGVARMSAYVTIVSAWCRQRWLSGPQDPMPATCH